MSKENNLTDFLTDVADAIREKKGTTDKINPQDFSDEIKSIKTSTSMWTGHVDVEGLKAIGWDDEDIAYFQEHGVNWMEEDDEYHKVSEDNKSLYGVLTADNIQEYKDRIVWLPKIDFSRKTSVNFAFQDMRNLLAVPILRLPKVMTMNGFFSGCSAIRCIKLINPKIEIMDGAFYNCVSLKHLSVSHWANVISGSTFYKCRNLSYIEVIELNLVGNINYMFRECNALSKLPNLNMNQITGITNSFEDCTSLVLVEINNLHTSVSFGLSAILHKRSLLYMIEHEAATSAITITLHAAAYARLSTDPDIIAALENHSLVSLASA